MEGFVGGETIHSGCIARVSLVEVGEGHEHWCSLTTTRQIADTGGLALSLTETRLLRHCLPIVEHRLIAHKLPAPDAFDEFCLVVLQR